MLFPAAAEVSECFWTNSKSFGEKGDFSVFDGIVLLPRNPKTAEVGTISLFTNFSFLILPPAVKIFLVILDFANASVKIHKIDFFQKLFSSRSGSENSQNRFFGYSGGRKISKNYFFQSWYSDHQQVFLSILTCSEDFFTLAEPAWVSIG